MKAIFKYFEKYFQTKTKVSIIVIIFFFCNCILFAQQPIANFTNDKNNGCGFVIVKFTDNSSNAPVSWSWKIYQDKNSDTLKSTLQNPIFAFYNVGKYHVSLTVKNASGSNSLLRKSLITVYKLPYNFFIPDRTDICVNNNINFKYIALASDTIIKSWNWDFGDGNFSMIQNPNHVYSSPGKYRVSLLVKDAHGCENEYRNTVVNISPRPVVDFTSDNTQFCSPSKTINFINKSTGTNLKYQWYINNSTFSVNNNPSLIFKNSGSFDISLKAIDQNSCFDSLTKKGYVQINTYYDTISSNIQSGCGPLTVSFKDMATSGAKIWKWYFGDGDSSNIQCPEHVYKNPGKYTVTLKTTNAFGCSFTKTNIDYIHVFHKPAVLFTVNDSINCIAPFEVTFVNKSTNFKSCNWDFGDGTIDTTQNPSHIYNAIYTYNVRLTIQDNNGCINSLTKKDFIQIVKPTIQISKSIDGGCKPLAVTYTNNSTFNSAIKYNKWYFGDGTTSTENNPTHIYTDTGSFDISLVIVDVKGCKDSLTLKKIVGVGSPPVIDFETNDILGCIPYKVEFKNNTVFAQRFSWNFGDGLTDNSFAPIHKYNTYPDNSGYVNVTLKATQYGCANSLTKNKYIRILPPIPGFKILNPTSCDTPFTAVFVNTSKYATKFIWDFKDGSPLENTNKDTVRHVFYDRGSHNIELTVYNSNSLCKNSKTQTVTISKIVPGFDQDLASVCMNKTISFMDTSYSNSIINKWTWDFGDGTTTETTVNSVNHKYKIPGNYNVSLKVTNQLNCSKIIQKNSVIIHPLPSPRFNADITEGCAPMNVSFSDISKAVAPSTIKKWFWNFGDGLTDINKNPQHIYKTNGNFTVSLKVTDSLGCDSTIFKTDYIKPTKPVAEFSLNKTHNLSDTLTCFPDSAYFNNTSSGVNLNYFWNFNDGTNSKSLNPIHKFSVDSTKTYHVQLTVTDKNNCVNTYSKLITIAHPVARFDGSPRYADCPIPIKYFKFVNASTQDVVKWTWSFGDPGSSSNNSSSIMNPQHSYKTAGYYDVSLTVRDQYGCYDSIMQNNFIFIDGPRGGFDFNEKSGCPPLKVSFLANSTNVDNYNWIFGDGSSQKTNIDSVIYTYHEEGKEFHPSLILETKTANGNMCLVPVFPFVNNGQLNETVRLLTLPKTNAGQDKEICKGDRVSITATGGLTYSWNNTKTTDVITESPITTSTYFVTATDKVCSKADSVVVFVNQLPHAIIEKDTSVCSGINISLTASGGTKYKWNTGSNETSVISVSPTTKTIYTVTVFDEKGCSAIKSVVVSINDSLRPIITGNKEICKGTSTKLTVQNYGVKYKWNTGELTSTINTPTLTDNQTYKVTVIDKSGCSGVTAVVVKVNLLPMAEAGEEKINCKGNFTDLMASGGIQYSWNTGEKTNFITVSPTTDQKYTVTVTDSKGCSSKDSVFVYAKNNPVIQKIKDTTICAGTKIYLKAVSNENIYKWSKGDVTSMIEVAPVNSTLYTVTVFNKWGCQTSERTTVHTISLPNIPDVPQELVCFNENRTPVQVMLSVNRPEMSYTYKWYNDEYNSNVIKTGTSLIVPDVTSSKKIFVEAISQYGCVSQRGIANIKAANKPNSMFTYESILPITELADTRFNNYSESKNENESMDYLWLFGKNEGVSTEKYPVYVFKDSGKYDVTLIITNSDKCSDTLSKSFQVFSVMAPWVPDAFTPNNDSHNDVLFVRGPVKQFSFDVYNHFGYKVFHSNDQSVGWDGRFKGLEEPEGNYMWDLLSITNDNHIVNMKGSVVLLR